MKVKFAFEIRTAHKNSLALMGHHTPKVVLQKGALKMLKNLWKIAIKVFMFYCIYIVCILNFRRYFSRTRLTFSSDFLQM